MSTCQSAPEEAPESLPEPRRLEETEPAELGRRRPLPPTFFVMPPALEADLFFLTRPPSLDIKSVAEGEAGALSPCPKYSLLAEPGAGEMGEPGRAGEFDPAF